MAKDIIVQDGFIYQKIGKAVNSKTSAKKVKVQKERLNPMDKLKSFMAKSKGKYTIKASKKGTYVKADKSVLNGTIVTFTNNKDYFVTDKTFWKMK